MNKIYVVHYNLRRWLIKRRMCLGNFLANKWEIHTLPEISKVWRLGQGRWMVKWPVERRWRRWRRLSRWQRLTDFLFYSPDLFKIVKGCDICFIFGASQTQTNIYDRLTIIWLWELFFSPKYFKYTEFQNIELQRRHWLHVNGKEALDRVTRATSTSRSGALIAFISAG